MSVLEAGWHGLKLEATRADDTASYMTSVGVCAYPAVEDFSTLPDATEWTVFGDAYWDAAGWLEITGNELNRKGRLGDDRLQPRQDSQVQGICGIGVIAGSIIETGVQIHVP